MSSQFARKSVVFWENLHSWKKVCTTAGHDGRVKFQVCLHQRNKLYDNSCARYIHHHRVNDFCSYYSNCFTAYRVACMLIFIIREGERCCDGLSKKWGDRWWTGLNWIPLRLMTVMTTRAPTVLIILLGHWRSCLFYEIFLTQQPSGFCGKSA